MPTSRKVKRTLLEQMPSSFTGKIYELGSGWGTLAIALAKQHPEAQVVAYELSPLPYLVSIIWKWITCTSNLRICRRNFFRTPLSDADVVVCYLYRGAMERLAGKFKKELPPHARILSHTFSLPGGTPSRTVYTADFHKTPLFVYE